jgi:ribosomal protein L30
MHQTVIKEDNPAIRGMVRAVEHMIECEEMK